MKGGQPLEGSVPCLRPTLTSLSPAQDDEADPERLQSSSDEDGDYTWTPTRRAATQPSAGRKARKGRAGKGQVGRGQVKPKENKKPPCPTQMKKKCVNGFIMFCRMNRKQYIRWVGVLWGPGWGLTCTVHPPAAPRVRRPCCLTHLPLPETTQ